MVVLLLGKRSTTRRWKIEECDGIYVALYDRLLQMAVIREFV
jgi:hypothetical protein